MLRCGKAPAERMHMHEVELLPLGDTDVMALGKWLSNHDNMVQYFTCLGGLWGWPARHAGRTVTFPRQGVQSVRVMADGQWWQRAVYICFHLASPSALGAWRGSLWFIGLGPPLGSNGRQSQLGRARDAGTYTPRSGVFGSKLWSLPISSHLNQVPLTWGYPFRNGLLF